MKKDYQRALRIRRWVKALRSGKYKQTKESLCNAPRDNIEDRGYCCLGIACDISGLGYWNSPETFPHHSQRVMYTYTIPNVETEDKVLPKYVTEYYGLLGVAGGGLGPLGNVHCDNLADFNDWDDTSFDTIADIIEEHYELLTGRSREEYDEACKEIP